MQIWCDIYPFTTRSLEWRIIIDPYLNKYVVVDALDRIFNAQPQTVSKQGDVYWVSDNPTVPGPHSNIQFKVKLAPPRRFSIVGGEGWHRHVIYINGREMLDKSYKLPWIPQEIGVPLPNIFEFQKLMKYRRLLMKEGIKII